MIKGRAKEKFKEVGALFPAALLKVGVAVGFRKSSSLSSDETNLIFILSREGIKERFKDSP